MNVEPSFLQLQQLLLELLLLLHHGGEICQQWMPSSPFRDLYDSLVCGLPLDSSRRQIFIDTGLIHLMVVSGAHLHFLEAWLKWLPPRARIVVVGFYCWLTSFGPPVVRAWFRRLCGEVFRRYCASVLQLEFVTLLVVLLFLPGWLFSRSFLMCWVCALAVSLPPVFPKWPGLSLSLVCYILLFPFCPSAPLTVLCNLLITPLVGGLMFPLCVFAAAIPTLVPLADEAWNVLLLCLNQLPVAPPAPITVFTKWLFLYPLALHAGLLMAEVPWRRARAFSC